MRIEDFDFDLPDELIAQYPPRQRGGGRLLTLDARGGLGDHRFLELPDLLSPSDLLVFNDTRVIRARLLGSKQTGGRVELLIERVLDARHALGMIRASHPPKAGTLLGGWKSGPIRVLERHDDLYRLQFPAGCEVLEFLDRHGEIPLPPYIARGAEPEDEARYQTVYARQPGAVAAPTAGLHFDEGMFECLESRGIGRTFVTLHVGAGTFQPIRVERIAEHRMHAERYRVPQETLAAIEHAGSRGGRVIAVGTTTLRALESAASGGAPIAGEGETELFITPGFEFSVVDALLTNFHLPRSTLLMLVAAFAGTEQILNAYRHAVASRYRFFSYGDAMLIEGA
jgi:S-adenosylmethionine:tRNA ribosyltransferase-isomerase